MAKGLPRSIVKKYGISKKAWQVYKSQKRGRRTSRKTKKSSGGRRTTRRRSSVGKKKTYRRRSFRIFGRFGWRGILLGAGAIAAIKYLIRRFAPGFAGYENSVALIGAGIIGPKSLGPAGITLGLADFIVDAVTPGGVYTLPGIGGKVRGYEIA